MNLERYSSGTLRSGLMAKSFEKIDVESLYARSRYPVWHNTYRPTVVEPGQYPRNAPRPLVQLSGGRYLTQNAQLPRIRGQVGFNGDCPAELEDQDIVTAGPNTQHTDSDFRSLPVEQFNDNILLSPSKSPHKKKRDRQWRRWLKEVIPSLVEPFMDLVEKTDNLRLDPPLQLENRCSCVGGRSLNVTVIRFTGIERVEVWFCSTCSPTAPQLVRSGLFPCAPFAPSLAVEIRMLDFLARLFLRISPNVTAWCGALSDYLRQQGYWLNGQDPLRRRFGNCLLWFNSLQDAIRTRLKVDLESTRPALSELHADTHVDGIHDLSPAQGGVQATSETSTTSTVGLTHQKRKHSETSHIGTANTNHQRNPHPSRVSAYLRSRCPMCFGGTTPPNASDQERAGPHVLVTLDACFTHKHNKQSYRDPPRLHPDTMYLPEDDVKKWEALVNEARPSKPSKRAKQKEAEEIQEDDHYEHGMRVPKSALDGCLGSFTAAQETITSSSSEKFDKTADAGMFCQHDVALFMVAIDSPGERQHYMLALIAELFKHIPDDWNVGILYDIGCQTERSCRKWGFLKEYLRRIIWGVSVFHAYGHNWPCQLIYHPRKRRWFGLCDGEGCERCWSCLRHLVAYTRVVGVSYAQAPEKKSSSNKSAQYYLHLYTIDTQLHYHNEQTLWGAAKWLQRKTRQCASRRIAAEKELDESRQDLTFLHAQWDEQVKAQTQPLPRQRRNAAKAAVQEALRLNESLDVLEQKITDLEKAIISKTAERYQTITAYDDLLKARKTRDELRLKLMQKERSLGTSDRNDLRKLMNDPYITKRLNALALKMRVRQKLEARKFALSRLERCFRKQRSEQKLHDHTRDSVQRRDPSILALASKYNNLCDDIEDLICCGKAPTHAVTPKKIDKSTLFNLDTDEDLWQDIGLMDDGDCPPPPWMVDDKVRKGIQAMLELDRCTEEAARLQIQRQSLQEWFTEEWKLVLKALEAGTGSTGLKHQLELRKCYLLRLFVTWEQSLVELSDNPSSLWGPSGDELAAMRRQLLLDSVEGEDIDDFGGAYLEDVEVGLTEQLDTRDIADTYWEKENSSI
ncbi:hypothetical protein VKT23_012336 [Stygiomarasmius scandens]|uniref:CxC2-like cysteine cluster KDZ transposase-associated domain-containing protein n=1 Tax=Marasmiellus scandens TaxID=2682957 RepID=A0ABR1J6Q8_9AGAR